jgi:hypothetical protein
MGKLIGRAAELVVAEGRTMVVRRGPFGKSDKVVAWILACVWVVGGGVGIALSVVNGHWRLGLASAGGLAAGILYAVATRRGRPL